MFKICHDQFRHTVLSVRFYVSLLIGVVMQIVAVMPLLEFAETMGSSLSIFDAFIYFNCDDYTASTAFLAVFLLASDIPFSNAHEPYTLMRTTRFKWLLGKIIYIICVCLVYYFLISIFGILYIVGSACAKNEWSYPISLLTKDTSLVLSTEYSVYFLYPYITSSVSPLCAYIMCLILSTAYAIDSCLLLFLFTLRIPRSIGFFLTILVHIIGYTFGTIIVAKFLSPLSLFGNSLLMYHKFGKANQSSIYLSVPQSLFLYLCVGMLIYIGLKHVIKTYDFRSA